MPGQRTGLYGRTVVSLVQRNAAEFPAHKITSGDIVGIIKQVTIIHLQRLNRSKVIVFKDETGQTE